MATKRKVKTESTTDTSDAQAPKDESTQEQTPEQQPASSIWLPNNQRRRPIYEEIDCADAKIEQLESSINDIEDEINSTSLPSRKLNELINKKKDLEKQLTEKRSEKKWLRIENFEMALLALMVMVGLHLGGYFLGVV